MPIETLWVRYSFFTLTDYFVKNVNPVLFSANVLLFTWVDNAPRISIAAASELLHSILIPFDFMVLASDPVSGNSAPLTPKAIPAPIRAKRPGFRVPVTSRK
jgi:hypothetical protein